MSRYLIIPQRCEMRMGTGFRSMLDTVLKTYSQMGTAQNGAKINDGLRIAVFIDMREWTLSCLDELVLK